MTDEPTATLTATEELRLRHLAERVGHLARPPDTERDFETKINRMARRLEAIARPAAPARRPGSGSRQIVYCDGRKWVDGVEDVAYRRPRRPAQTPAAALAGPRGYSLNPFGLGGPLQSFAPTGNRR